MSLDSPSSDIEYSAISTDDAVAAVVEILAEKNRATEHITSSSSLSDLGLDSLDTAELFMALEDISGTRLDPDSAANLHTVADLTRLKVL